MSKWWNSGKVREADVCKVMKIRRNERREGRELLGNEGREIRRNKE